MDGKPTIAWPDTFEDLQEMWNDYTQSEQNIYTHKKKELQPFLLLCNQSWPFQIANYNS